MRNLMTKLPNGAVAEWIKFVSSALVIPMFAFMFIWIISIERRITAIESSRFTTADGVRMLSLINAKADRSEVPPPWLIESLNDIKSDIRELRIMYRDKDGG